MLRNLEEQVLYLTEVVEQIQQVLGNALPDPIPGPPGEPGEKGVKGDPGPQGFGIVGYGTQLPDSGRDGDWFILKTSTMTGIDYVMYKCVMQHWVAQFSMRGPAGPIANATEVVANPNEPMSEELKKLKVDGVVYGTPTGNYVKYIAPPESTTLTDEQIEVFVNGVFINGNFLDLKNPVFFPAYKDNDYGYYCGLCMSAKPNTYVNTITTYLINENKVISLAPFPSLDIGNVYSFNGRNVPEFPVSPAQKKVLTYNEDNSLTWDNKPTTGITIYRHSVSCSVPYSGYSFNLQIVFYSTLNEGLDNVDDLWSYLVTYLQCYLGDWLCYIKNKNANSIEIYDVKNATTISLAKSDFTFNSDTFSAI